MIQERHFEKRLFFLLPITVSPCQITQGKERSRSRLVIKRTYQGVHSNCTTVIMGKLGAGLIFLSDIYLISHQKLSSKYLLMQPWNHQNDICGLAIKHFAVGTSDWMMPGDSLVQKE